MRLTERELDILGKIRLHGDLSVPELAKLTGHQVHTVRYTIEKLKKQGALKLRCIIDHFALGWGRYSVFFSLASGDIKKLEDFFLSRSHIIHFGEAGGAYDYGFAMLAKSADEVLFMLEDACRKSGASFSTRIMAFQNHIAYFDGKSFIPRWRGKSDTIEIGGGNKVVTISKLEDQILKALAASPETSKVDLAKKLGVSQPTIHERIKSLKDRGVIKGMRWSLSSRPLEYERFKILVRTSHFNADSRKKLFEYLRDQKICSSLRAGIGAWDFEINYEAKNIEDIVEARKELWEKFSGYISSMELLPRLGLRKYTSYSLD